MRRRLSSAPFSCTPGQKPPEACHGLRGGEVAAQGLQAAALGNAKATTKARPELGGALKEVGTSTPVPATSI